MLSLLLLIACSRFDLVNSMMLMMSKMILNRKSGCWCFFGLLVLIGPSSLATTTTTTGGGQRSFYVDHARNCLMKDGQPFQYIAGTMHYFRVPHQYWQDRFRKMKYGGLNAIQTYVEWNTHEPQPGRYDFEGQNDLVRYIQMAQNEGLNVILRVGPYICAERDFGGLPYWLLKTPGIKLRSSDPKFLQPLFGWLDVLLPKIKPLLYQNGGPILMVQFENEYGSWISYDLNYTVHLRNKFQELLGKDAVLFTTDGPGDSYLRRGHVPDTLTTVDFGVEANVSNVFSILRRHQDFGPFINSEYYSGWFDQWEREFSTVADDKYCRTLEQMFQMNASVNIYVYHGGTNFGLRSSSLNNGFFGPTTTSYDFDAPITEAGDLRPKFFAIKNVIAKYFPENLNDNDDAIQKIANTSEKMSLPPVRMQFAGTFFDTLKSPKFQPKYPISFEQADHDYGFMLYQTRIDFHPCNPAILQVPGLRDRAHVFVDRRFAGILSRTQNFLNISILAHNGSTLNLLVENQGRCSWGACVQETKGIVSNVTIVQCNQSKSVILENWNIYPMYEDWTTVLQNLRPSRFEPVEQYRTPSFYIGNFTVPDQPNYPLDSFIRVDGWSKGVAFLNGFNLGRYWPVAGPQITLYAPAVYFNQPNQTNQIVLFELDDSPCWFGGEQCQMQFVKEHIVNGSYPN